MTRVPQMGVMMILVVEMLRKVWVVKARDEEEK